MMSSVRQSDASASSPRPNRLLDRLAEPQRKLVCYFPLGDPKIPFSMLQVYAECGVDIVELGIPEADPFMDGEVVRTAMHRALEPQYGRATARLHETLKLLEAMPHGPVGICMGYATSFRTELLDLPVWSDLDGMLMVGLDDHPEAARIRARFAETGTELVNFVSADLPPEDVAAARACRSYIMLQATPGATGARDSFDPANAQRIADLRAAGVTAPIFPGFGISTPEQVSAAVACGADGVIIGSACVAHAEQGPRALHDFLSAVRRALHV